MRVRSAVSIVENPTTPDPTLLWYSRAIGILRTSRKFADPTSWRFQGAVHDYTSKNDPYLDPSDPAPTAAVQQKYFAQCQHSSWYFLPWHRMYLYHFEQIVADAVVQAGGPSNWSLPYWDYGAGDAARKLPWAFRQPTWPGGETNYLYLPAPSRAAGIANGAAMSTNDVESATALGMPLFSTTSTSSDVQFGGPRVKNHDGGTYPFGGVEQSPHNHVHVAVGGGPKGFMYDPATAALDPIFWLHHANIDRLWESWVRTSPHANPTESAWLTAVAFPFFDAKGKPVSMTPSQVLSTSQLGYSYEGLPPVLHVNPALLVAALKKPKRPTFLGATAASFSIPLGGGNVTIPTDPDARPVATESAEPERVMLHFENLTAKERPGAYDVYINVPPGADAAAHPELHAGRISLFGARQEDRRTRSHARDGFSFVLDISKVVRTLTAVGVWDPNGVQVTLRRVYEWSDEVKVGRVSVNVRA